MKAFVFDQSEQRRLYTSFVLEACFLTEVVASGSLPEAMKSVLNKSETYDLIVCDFDEGGSRLMREVFAAGDPVHFLCASKTVPDLSASQKLKFWVHFLPREKFCQDLLPHIGALFKGSEDDPRPAEQRFSEVPLPLLVALGTLPTDVYLYDQGKYVQAMAQGVPFKDRHAELIAKKGRLFIRAERARDVARALQVALFPGTVALPEKQAAKLAPKEADISQQLQKDFEAVQEMSSRVGFTPEVQEITRKNVLKTIAEVRKAPRLANVLKELNRDPTQYISSHSMLLAHVACAIATEVEWKSDATFQKLTLAAFLHDITLKNQRLAAMPSIDSVNQSKDFSEEEKKQYKLHPSSAAEIARGFDEVPPDVDVAIAQHHERPDGSGFPRGLTNTRISPLSAVFIVAHDVVDYLLQNEGGKVDLQEVAKQHPSTYKAPTFRRLLAVAEKLKT